MTKDNDLCYNITGFFKHGDGWQDVLSLSIPFPLILQSVRVRMSEGIGGTAPAERRYNPADAWRDFISPGLIRVLKPKLRLFSKQEESGGIHKAQEESLLQQGNDCTSVKAQACLPSIMQALAQVWSRCRDYLSLMSMNS